MRPPAKTPFFDLKRNYLIYFESCLILSLATFIGLFKLPIPDPTNNKTFHIPTQELLQLHQITPINLLPTLSETPPSVIIPVTPIPDFIFEEHLKDIELELTELNRLLPLADKYEMVTEAEVQDNTPDPASSVSSERLPLLIGGMASLQNRIKYPPKAIKDKVEGRVVIQFIVDRKGKVRNPKVIRGVRYDLDNAAMRAVAKSRFRPAQLDGTTIPVEHVLHILFKIEYKS